MKDRLKAKDLHWRMNMPGSIDMFYKSRKSKHRYGLKRIRKILDRDFEKKILFKVYKQKRNVDEFIVNAEAIAKKTYQWALNQAIRDTPEMRKRLTSFAERSQFRGYILYINNKPCAFWLGRRYKNIFYLMLTGYDPEFKKYELGTVLFVFMIQELIDNTEIECLDLGFSDQPYKARFGNKSWQEGDLLIFGNNWIGFKLSLLRTIIGFTWLATRELIEKVGIKNKLKRFIRDRLIKHQKGTK
jgi:hypothetical protein